MRKLHYSPAALCNPDDIRDYIRGELGRIKAQENPLVMDFPELAVKAFIARKVR
jgi:hypothetical protein